VFTEYRDTLLHLQRAIARPAAILHGGLTRDDRSAAIASFTSGRYSLLLATDAAGEGLNLHHACRVVVNLELPWNPMRLEQRIGRVDRIGQRRTVHAFHLVSRDTAEQRMLDLLNARIARAASDIGSADPIGMDNESAIARLILGSAAKEDDDPTVRSRSDLMPIDLKAEALAEAERLTHARRFAATDADEAAARRLDRPWLSFARSRRARVELASRVVLLFNVACEDQAGRLVESTLVPLAADWRGTDWLRAAAPALTVRADAAAAVWRQQAASVARRFLGTLLARERAIRLEITDRPIADRRFAFQPGLFDRRAERRTAADRMTAAEAMDDASRRLQSIESAAHLTTRPELWLLLAP